MFDHVTIRVADRDASERFYNTVLSALGVPELPSGEHYAGWDDFSLAVAAGEEPVTRGLHIGFVAPSHAAADAFWLAGTEIGYEDDGAPGPRAQYGDDYYGAFLLDPDGNSIEAVHHGHLRPGPFDHLWIRVADVAAASRFYELIASWSRYPLDDQRDGFAHFRGSDGSFSLVADGPPTENLHLAFSASDNRTVQEFHRAAVEAGYRDNGPAGERAVYHAGYYGAFVLDPDGNNIEVVNHHRD